MSRAAREFAEDPCSSVKRGNMVRAARNLLSAVTRLLILADMVDVHRLLKSLQVVSVGLGGTKSNTMRKRHRVEICLNTLLDALLPYPQYKNYSIGKSNKCKQEDRSVKCSCV